MAEIQGHCTSKTWKGPSPCCELPTNLAAIRKLQDTGATHTSTYLPEVEAILQVEQAGFRTGRSTCDQVLALTTFIENGFQKQLKTGAVFLDLSAAYDTV